MIVQRSGSSLSTVRTVDAQSFPQVNSEEIDQDWGQFHQPMLDWRPIAGYILFNF